MSNESPEWKALQAEMFEELQAQTIALADHYFWCGQDKGDDWRACLRAGQHQESIDACVPSVRHL